MSNDRSSDPADGWSDPADNGTVEDLAAVEAALAYIERRLLDEARVIAGGPRFYQPGTIANLMADLGALQGLRNDLLQEIEDA